MQNFRVDAAIAVIGHRTAVERCGTSVDWAISVSLDLNSKLQPPRKLLQDGGEVRDLVWANHRSTGKGRGFRRGEAGPPASAHIRRRMKIPAALVSRAPAYGH
jgi:hypothetical protein